MKNVCNTVDSKHGAFILDSTVKNSSQLVFALYEKVRALEAKYDQICGGGYEFNIDLNLIGIEARLILIIWLIWSVGFCHLLSAG